jgi:Reverse transcriptase (RNA-dependent DNA polymerase)
MSDRTMRFAFDSEIGPLISVNSGIPQGSPISPIMFLIYLQHIFQTLDHWPEIELINYINDITLITGSSCARTNGIRLQLAV